MNESVAPLRVLSIRECCNLLSISDPRTLWKRCRERGVRPYTAGGYRRGVRECDLHLLTAPGYLKLHRTGSICRNPSQI